MRSCSALAFHCTGVLWAQLAALAFFLQEGFVAEDDFGASADYTRENDDEAAAIAERKRWDEKNAALQTAQVFSTAATAD